MSEETTKSAEEQAQPTVGEVLFFKAYVPKFVKECSAKGIEFKSEEDLFSALRIADRIRMAKAAEQAGVLDTGSTKEASESLLKQAADSLDSSLSGTTPAFEQDLAVTLQDADVQAALGALRA